MIGVTGDTTRFENDEEVDRADAPLDLIGELIGIDRGQSPVLEVEEVHGAHAEPVGSIP